MDPRIENAILFIANKFHTNIKLRDLAGAANMSEFHFHRVFKEATNETPLEYLTRIKLEHAAHLLILHPQLKYFEVAFECGFSSPATFSRAFKSLYKISPSGFRKKTLLQNEKSEFYTSLHQNINEKVNAPTIPVKYFKSQKVAVNRVSLVGNTLNNTYKALIKNYGAINAYGFYIDMPFHVGLEKSRHYIGIENDSIKTNYSQSIDIPAGYFTYLDIEGDYNEITHQVISFKSAMIDPSPYMIKSTFAFEKISLPPHSKDFEYFKIKRRLFISVKKE